MSVDDSKRSGARRGRPVAAVLLLASTLGVMGGAAIAPMVEVIRGELGIGATAIGMLLTVHSLAIAVTAPLIGRLCDRMGPRVPLGLGLVLFAVGGGAGLFVDHYPTLMAFRVVLGVGCGAVFTCSTVALLALYRGPERDRMLGLRTTAISVGGFVYPVAAGALGHISWQSPFAVYLIGLPLGVACLLVVPARPAPRSGPGATAPAGGPVDGTTGTGRGGVVRLLRDHPVVAGLTGLWAAAAALMMVVGIQLPRRLAELGVGDPLVVAIMVMVTGGAASAVVGLLFGRLRERFDHIVLLRTAVLLWTVSLLVFAVADRAWLLIAVPLLNGVGNGLVMPSTTALIDRAVPEGRRGLATSLQATAMFGGQFASPLIFGSLVDSRSVTSAALAAAAGTVLLLLALTRLRRALPAPAVTEPRGAVHRTSDPGSAPRSVDEKRT
ncbi:MFS transporter [Streptomyces sp. ST2-7A]|uniref:MFS transporter n=1 Tax=Streptomyces sp. ST2-7A TaxID=2907214 RepID=UPI001F2C496D|nr:MFS transporter [Streptomyces sp. ST2-7A]MCE7080955.1 MFS transporter [Streptomyces sp. ST2-7A]